MWNLDKFSIINFPLTKPAKGKLNLKSRDFVVKLLIRFH